jgi:MFS family permease
MARIAIDLSPLRASRELRLLMAGQGVGMIGGMVLYVAIPIQLYAETHSTLAVGLIGLVELGPLLVASILGGAIADVVERVRMAVRVELGVAATAALLALNSVTGPNVAALYVLAGASTGISCLGLPASRALLPNLVPQERLAAANALNGTVINFGAVAGPGIGGVLVAVLGATGAYLAGGVVVLAGAATLRLLPPVPTKPGEEQADRVSVRTIIDGFRYVTGTRVVLGVFLADTTAMIFGSPRALFPAFADDLGGSATAVGLLYAMPYLGALIASLASGWTSHVRRQGRWVNGMIVLWGASIAAFGLVPNVVLALAFLALAGAADTLSAIFRSVIVQQETPDAMRGRVGGIELAQVAATPLVGDFEAGLVASLTSVRTSIVSGGVMCIVAIVVLTALVPALDRYRRPEHATTT